MTGERWWRDYSPVDRAGMLAALVWAGAFMFMAAMAVVAAVRWML